MMMPAQTSIATNATLITPKTWFTPSRSRSDLASMNRGRNQALSTRERTSSRSHEVSSVGETRTSSSTLEANQKNDDPLKNEKSTITLPLSPPNQPNPPIVVSTIS